jgi:hypothetical protein
LAIGRSSFHERSVSDSPETASRFHAPRGALAFFLFPRNYFLNSLCAVVAMVQVDINSKNINSLSALLSRTNRKKI